MNGLTATGVTVGICAGLWQLVSSHVGLSNGWELLGTIGFVAFCSFYAAGGGKSGFIRSLAVNYSGMVWAFFAALAAGWLAPVSGISGVWASVITTVPFSAVVVWQGRFWLLSFIPGGFLGMTLFFASGLNWTVTLRGFLAGNCVGIISEYGGQKLRIENGGSGSMNSIFTEENLLAFTTAARFGSFSKAAEELGLTTSAISYTIKRM